MGWDAADGRVDQGLRLAPRYFCQLLSARGQPPYSRARSVLAFLVPRGIASARLEARGYGARRPLPAGTPRGLVPNKHVELHPVHP